MRRRTIIRRRLCFNVIIRSETPTTGDDGVSSSSSFSVLFGEDNAWFAHDEVGRTQKRSAFMPSREERVRRRKRTKTPAARVDDVHLCRLNQSAKS